MANYGQVKHQLDYTPIIHPIDCSKQSKNEQSTTGYVFDAHARPGNIPNRT